MSWLFKSFQSDGPDSSESHQTSSPERSPSTTPRGVKDDLSLLGQTLGRQLRGVADFLAPPPPPNTIAVDSSDSSSSSQSQPQPQPQPLLGIRNDLVEIGGSFRTGLSLLSGNKAVSEISRLASNLLQFESYEVRDEEASGEEDDDDRIDEGVPGVNDEVLDFVSEISTLPELWIDFPLSLENDFDMSDAQREHASAVERLAPSLAALRVKLQSDMSEEQFWIVYFILLLPRLSEHDVELLSTSKIIEARNVLLQKLQKNAQVENEGTNTLGTSQDGSKAGKPEGKNIPSDEKEVSTDNNISAGVEMGDEESSEKWLQEKDIDTGAQKKVEHEEDISFSDLEDDDNNALSKRPPVSETKVSSPSESSDWVQLNRSSDAQCSSGQHKAAGQSNSGEKDSEGEESNDWLTVDDFD